MKNKLDVLYVHGYNGSGSGTTATSLSKLLNKDKFNFLSPDFSNRIADIEDNIHRINELISELHPEIVIGNSLGTFEVMNAKKGMYKILINPVFNPVTDLLKRDVFDDSIELVRDRIGELASNIEFDKEDIDVTYGFFGSKDDRVNCQAKFECILGAKNLTVIDGAGHKLTEEEMQAVVNLINKMYDNTLK